MNTLWIFGDNNSAIFGKTTERRYYHYKKYRNGNFPKTWSEIISSKLNLRLKNLAIKGQSNYDIFEMFAKCCADIKKDDVVIIGWGFIERFRLADEFTQSLISVRPGQFKLGDVNIDECLKGIDLLTIKEMLDNRKQKKIWKEEVYDWENLINLLSKLIGFKILYWTFDNDLQRPHYISGKFDDFRKHLVNLGAEDITAETKGFLTDENFGEIGQAIQSDYFLNYIRTI